MSEYCDPAFHNESKHADPYAVFSLISQGSALDKYECCARFLHKHYTHDAHHSSVYSLVPRVVPLLGDSLVDKFGCYVPSRHTLYTHE